MSLLWLKNQSCTDPELVPTLNGLTGVHGGPASRGKPFIKPELETDTNTKPAAKTSAQPHAHAQKMVPLSTLIMCCVFGVIVCGLAVVCTYFVTIYCLREKCGWVNQTGKRGGEEGTSSKEYTTSYVKASTTQGPSPRIHKKDCICPDDFPQKMPNQPHNQHPWIPQFKNIGQSEYAFSSGYKVTWEEAWQQCHTANAELLVVEDETEWHYLYSHLQIEAGTFWIGISNTHSPTGRYKWTVANRNITFQNWASSDFPTNTLAPYCAVVTVGLKWITVPCNRTAAFICEKNVITAGIP